MPLKHSLAAVVLILAFAGSCADDNGATTANVSSATTIVSDSPSISGVVRTTAQGASSAATAASDSPSTSGVVGSGQPAIWPAADVVFSSPEEAAGDFVAKALGGDSRLGQFQQGDGRSGEMEVFVVGEGGSDTSIVRSVLQLRQLGRHEGWFILSAVSSNASITAPESMSQIVAGPLTIEGVASGYEATIWVTAFLAGEADNQLDMVTAMAGAYAPEPFSVTLDLSKAAPGNVVTLLVGSESGGIGAIPVVIST
jgi:hypothetical protein